MLWNICLYQADVRTIRYGGPYRRDGTSRFAAAHKDRVRIAVLVTDNEEDRGVRKGPRYVSRVRIGFGAYGVRKATIRSLNYGLIIYDLAPRVNGAHEGRLAR